MVFIENFVDNFKMQRSSVYQNKEEWLSEDSDDDDEI